MQYIQTENKTVLSGYTDFDIEETLECGQCFRFTKQAPKEYTIIAFGKVLHITQKEKTTEFYPTGKEEFEDIWIHYFDLNRNYDEIKSSLSENDEVLKKAILFAGGIRILNQDPWECLISFIISQNNRIPMIKQVIKNICQAYGKNIEDGCYAFPCAESLLNTTVPELMLCKTGFRAKYILDAALKISNGKVKLYNNENISTPEMREMLIQINGVGPKVADCALLFSQKRSDVFPTDVWVKRVMQYFYFENKDTSIKEIQSLAEKKFGAYAGFAQQYLFNYARQLKIGAKGE